MKTLIPKVPTPEQLRIIENPKPGVRLIRGAAGSGKTTTALLMLRQLTTFWKRRKERQGLPEAVNILVITYNRTLKGYIKNLAEAQVTQTKEINLKISTFGKWSKGLYPEALIVEDKVKDNYIQSLVKNASISIPSDFALKELEYMLGRFTPEQFDEYISCRRIGRGISPRMEHTTRRPFIENVILPYNAWKEKKGYSDWNDLALKILTDKKTPKYDIIIADEAQDLSANQVRALMHCAADPSTVVFVLDAAQRIYPRGFVWKEAGVNITHSYQLKENHRNTKEICKFVTPLLEGLDLGDDGTLPDLQSCTRSGPLPFIIKGKYSQQASYVINHIRSYIDLSKESVAFLHPVGWFNALKKELSRAGLEFVTITRKSEWPRGPQNIALSTLHSAKGLEFDHVFILGLNEEITPHGSEPGDDQYENLRRTLAVGITRARESVILGYKLGEASSLFNFFLSDAYREISL